VADRIGHVPPRLTIFPPLQALPNLYWQIPAIKRIGEAYEKRFDVAVFDWPFFAPGGAHAPQDLIAAVHDGLSVGGLVVAEAPAVTPLLVALERGARRPDAFVAVGLDPTNATMRSLGLAEVVEAAKRLTDTEGRLRQVRGFLSEAVRDPELLSEVEKAVPWEAVFAFEDWLEEVDQLQLGPFEDVRALVFTSAMFPLLAEGETEHVFKHLFPNSTAHHVETYPHGLDNPATGDELTRVVIPFLTSVSAGGDFETEDLPVEGEKAVTAADQGGATLARPFRGWEAGPYMWGGVWRLKRR
jgi:hypothetical protein